MASDARTECAACDGAGWVHTLCTRDGFIRRGYWDRCRTCGGTGLVRLPDVHIIAKDGRPFATVHANNRSAVAWLEANRIPMAFDPRYVVEYAKAIVQAGLTIRISELT